MSLLRLLPLVRRASLLALASSLATVALVPIARDARADDAPAAAEAAVAPDDAAQTEASPLAAESEPAVRIDAPPAAAEPAVEDDAPLGPRAARPFAPPADPAPAAPRIKSKAMVIVGSILSGVGAAGLVGGGVMYAQAQGRECVAAPNAFGLDAAFCEMGRSMDEVWATAMMVSGAAHTAVGVPLLAVGARTPRGEEAPPAPTPSLAVGATGATFTLRF